MRAQITLNFDEDEAEQVVTLVLGLDERLSFMEQQLETLLEKVNELQHGQKPRKRTKKPCIRSG